MKTQPDRTSKRSRMPTIGWREWIKFPEFEVKSIKAKVDTGARSSSLHAFNMKPFNKGSKDWVRFEIHPRQRSGSGAKVVEAKVLEYRNVKSSSGKVTRRPVILTEIELMGETWPIEVTLASRDEMGFRKLLGREAIRNRFLVDSGKSYYGGKPPRKTKNKK